MDHHVAEYFSQYSDETPSGNFHRVIALHEAIDVDWPFISKQIPGFSKGWFELTHVCPKDRVEFIRDYWISKLPYQPGLNTSLDVFFGQLDDIGVYITQRTWDEPFIASLVYSLKGNRGFYRGMLPASEMDIVLLQRSFPEHLLPADYLAFLQIHDGFCKTTDCTGILQSNQVAESYQQLQAILANKEPLFSSGGGVVNPTTLIPFYESFGMPFYQCFWGEWYPEDEMGNVYYSVFTHEISHVKTNQASPENMTFPTFNGWLMFYLEQVI